MDTTKTSVYISFCILSYSTTINPPSAQDSNQQSISYKIQAYHLITVAYSLSSFWPTTFYNENSTLP